MKLAFCLFKYFPYGGLQRDFMRIASECHLRGHKIHVYTMHWEGEHHAGFEVHYIKPRGWQNHARCHDFSEKVKPALDAGQYDLVIGFNKMPHLDIYYAADVCYQARVREQRSFLYRLLPRYRKWKALEHAVFAKGEQTHIMLISPQQKHEFMHHYRTESERFQLLPPGIARNHKALASASDIRQVVRKTHQIRDDEFLLLMVGSGFKTKGLDRVIKGIAALPGNLSERCRLFVIGQDNPASFIKLAKQLQLDNKVHFLGGRSDVPELMLTADILLHPAYHENTGTVILEAIISGLPVLTVDVCGYAHYVNDANAGVVLPSPFHQSVFNAALQMMLLSDKRKHWQGNGLAFAEQADIYSMPTKAADFIEHIGRQRGPVSTS